MFTHSDSRAEVVVRWTLIVLTAIPFITAATRAIATDWFPIGDSALLYIRTTDVATGHHPWLGSWSSASIALGYDVNNPGPMYDDLMAPFAHTFGAWFGPGVGNVTGVIAINLACLFGAALAAHRVGGWAFERWVLAAGAALAWAMGSELLFDIFQAHALMFPFLAGVVLLVAILDRQRWAWPWLVAVLSLILQTHISFAYIVAILVATTVIALVVDLPAPRWPPVRKELWTRTTAWCAGIFALLWIQPVLEQLFGEGEGNLSRLLRSATGTEISVGFANAVRLVAAIFVFPPWWTRTGFADTIEPAYATEVDGEAVVSISGVAGGVVSAFGLIALVAVLVVAFRWSRTRSHRALSHLTLLSAVSVVGAVIALSRLTVGTVGLAPHHTRWVFVLALLTHVALLWTGLAWLDTRLRLRERWPHVPGYVFGAAVPALIVVGFGAANLPYFAQAHGPTADVDTMPAMRQLFAELDQLEDDQPVLYRSDNIRLFEPYSSAVQLQLRHRDVEFRVDEESLVRQLGNARRADGTEPATLAQYERWTAFSGDYDGCLLATGSALDPDDADALAERAERLAADLEADVIDLRGVSAAADSTDLDRFYAAAITNGDGEAIREVVFNGMLYRWVDNGWVGGDESLLTRVRADGPEFSEWLDSYVVLAVTPDDVCD